MLNRESLEKELEKEIIVLSAKSNTFRKISDYAKNNYDIPRSVMLDLLSMRSSMSQESDFVIFCLLESIEKVTETNKTSIDKYFTMKEFKTYKQSKYQTKTIKFPLRFKVNKVSEDQWIGAIDINTIMELRKSQLINYNVNAQRTMQRIIKGDKEVYKITINNTAVSAIKDLYQKGIYIPTPFTLNIPEDEESNFYYDEDKRELVIKSLKHFDITDGYHRYIAACQLKDTDENFNYMMELRISNWSDDKAKQFIYQEDQKTKMRKVDSNSLNMNKAANIVVNRINESSQCNLQGLISRNKGIINFGDLSELVNYFYFKGITKEKEKSTIISTVRELIENFNMITEYSSVYLEKEYSYKQLVAIICMFNYYKGKNKKDMLNKIDEIINQTEKLDNKKFYSKIPKKSMMNDIENIIKGA